MQIPKNIVQTGSVDPCHKMYIEDYVHIFLKQHQDEKADFCLYGKTEKEEEVTYYFLYGAAKEDAGWETMEARYFGEMHRIGEASCDGKEIWFFLEDGYAAPMDGYFVFYEQNEDMQSYLIAMHQNQPGEKEVTVHPRVSRQTADAAAEMSEAGWKNTPDPMREQSSRAMYEPRRIHRRPYTYSQDVKTAREKADSAGIRRSAVQQPGRNSFSLGRAIPAAALLLLCAMGISSINGYPQMQEAGTLFGDVIRDISETESPADENADNTRSSDYTENTALPEPSADSIKVAKTEENALTETNGLQLLADQPQGLQNEPQTDSQDATQPTQTQAEPADTYTVKKGDNLAAICRTHYGNTDRIQEVITLNNLSDPNHLYPGQKIILPH